jgi:hypothetical protein
LALTERVQADKLQSLKYLTLITDKLTLLIR